MAEKSEKKAEARRKRPLLRRIALVVPTTVAGLLFLAVAGVVFAIQSHVPIEPLRAHLEDLINDKAKAHLQIAVGGVHFASTDAGISAVARDVVITDAKGRYSATIKEAMVRPHWGAIVEGRTSLQEIRIADVAFTYQRALAPPPRPLPKPDDERSVRELMNDHSGVLGEPADDHSVPMKDANIGVPAFLPPMKVQADGTIVAYRPEDLPDEVVETPNASGNREPDALRLAADTLARVGRVLDRTADIDLERAFLEAADMRYLDENGAVLHEITVVSAQLVRDQSENGAMENAISLTTLQRGAAGVSAEVIYGRDPETDMQTFRFAIDNVIARNFIAKLNEPDYGVKIELPFGARGHFDVSPDVRLSRADITLLAGEGWFETGPKSLVNVDSGTLILTLDDAQRHITVKPSPFVFGKNELRPEGRIILPPALNDPYLFDLASNYNYFDSPDIDAPPLSVERISARGAFQPKARVVTITDFATESDVVAFSGSATFGFNGRTPSMAASAQIGPLETDVLKQAWPVFIAPSARAWTNDNVHSGRFNGGTIEASVPSGVLGNLRKGATMRPEDMRFTFSMSDAYFSSFGAFPDIEAAEATAEVRGIAFDLQLTSGRAKADDGDLVDLQEGRFTIPDFRFPDPLAQISLTAKGEADDIGAIANREPVQALVRADMEAENLTGSVLASVSLQLPLSRTITGDDVNWMADLTVEDFASSAPIDGRTIEDANATVNLNREQMLIAGTGRIDGIEANIDLSQSLTGEGARPSVAVQVVLNEAERKKLGIELDDYLKGPVTVDIDRTSETSGQEGEFHRLDLSKAEIRLDFLGWRKAAGIPARGQMRIITTDTGTLIRDFEISGEGFGASGQVDLGKDGSVKKIQLTRLQLKRGDNLQVTATLRSEKTYEVQVRGSSFDARSLIRRVTNAPQEEETAGYRYRIDTAIGRVRGYEDVTLRNLSASLTLRGNTILRLSANGATGGSSSPFSIRYGASQNVGDVLTAQGPDAGALFRFANIYYRAFGGAFAVSGVRPTGQRAMAGTFKMRNFTLVEEPALKSITAAKDSQGRSAVRFNTLEARFSEENQELTLKKGLVAGEEVGGTYRGVLDRRTKIVNFTGTYVPAYVLNNLFSKIPLVGPIIGNGREGLIGVTFKVNGPIGQPTVTVNPLSALAPGFLRQIFRFRQNSQQGRQTGEVLIDDEELEDSGAVAATRGSIDSGAAESVAVR
ncbi:MAG: DUF3971 domain-containing protein [Pseudomonadota bacterium]